MSNIVQYVFEANPVRIVQDESGDMWFVAKDLCDVIDHSHTGMATQGLDDDEKGKRKVATPGGEQDMLVVSEAGMYKLLMRSNLPKSKPFMRWLTHDVVPSIRKTGTYSINPISAWEQLIIQAQMGLEQERRANEQRAMLETQQRLLAQTELKVDKAQDTADAAFQRAECNLGHFSVMGYAARKKVKLNWKDAARHGKQLTLACNGLGIKVGKLADPRFGEVNSYPENVLEEYFAGEGLL